ncbi:MAG: glucose 1-dehydrogenase [Alphaproteobacteria bacterium]|nr:glucose 1-dehydrogenase [Alphaproteobacteria bacterium]
MRLENKVAIVTGGGSGFGEGIARRFAAEGAKVIVNDINVTGGERVANTIRQQGGQAAFVKADVAKSADVKAMVKAALDAFGRVDIMINNAGYTHRNQSMLTVDEGFFDRIFAVNVKAIYLAALEVVPVFRQQGGGVILNTASTAGLRPRPGLTIYNASKGAAITMTKSMAVEFAPDRIRVNCLCPVAGDTPENRARFKASVPLGRFSMPEDIANAALYLCSDEANFITGVAMEVDGGRCI